jgi:tetratricopeptide (TPR) repeat protein
MSIRNRTPRAVLRAATVLVLACAGCQVEKTQEERKDSMADWFNGGPMQLASAETLQLTARVLAAKGQTEQAGFLLDRLLAEYPDRIGTYSEGAEVLLIQGRVVDAIALLNQGVGRFPDNAVLLNDRGLCHLLNADLPAATADFQKAYDTDPADADYVGNLALVKALAGDDAAARKLWSRVLTPEEVDRNLSTARDARPKFKAAPNRVIRPAEGGVSATDAAPAPMAPSPS